MQSDSFRFIYITAGDAEAAQALGERLVEARLAACANILGGMTAIYRWQGKLCKENEAVLILKTRAALVPELIAQVEAWHSYDCPCVVSLPIESGHEPYLQWLGENTRAPEEET